MHDVEQTLQRVRNKGGRPRREGVERSTTGKVKSSEYETPAAAAERRRVRAEERAAINREIEQNAIALARWERLRELIRKLVNDPLLGSPLGRMLVLGSPVAIGWPEYEAGLKFEKVQSAYDTLVLSRRRRAKAADWVSITGRGVADEPSAELIERATGQMNECRSILARRKGMYDAVEALLADDEWEHRAALAAEGLRLLAQFWGMGKAPRSSIRRSGDKLEFQPEDRVRAFEIIRKV